MAQLDRELSTLEVRAGKDEGPTPAPPQAGPCVMIIFGASGDLTARKLLPALYNLAKSNMLSREFAIVGVARNDYSTDQFRQMMSQKLRSFATSSVDGALPHSLVHPLFSLSSPLTH